MRAPLVNQPHLSIPLCYVILYGMPMFRLGFTRPATPRLNPASHSSSGWYSELAGTTLLTFLLPSPHLSPLLKEPLTDPLPPAAACCPSSRTCMHVSVLITPCLQNKLPSLLTWHFQPALLFHLVCWSAPPKRPQQVVFSLCLGTPFVVVPVDP